MNENEIKTNKKGRNENKKVNRRKMKKKRGR